MQYLIINSAKKPYTHCTTYLVLNLNYSFFEFGVFMHHPFLYRTIQVYRVLHYIKRWNTQSHTKEILNKCPKSVILPANTKHSSRTLSLINSVHCTYLHRYLFSSHFIISNFVIVVFSYCFHSSACFHQNSQNLISYFNTLAMGIVNRRKTVYTFF